MKEGDAMQPMYAGQPNSPQTELATAIDDTQDTIEVLNGSVLPDAPNLAVLGAGELAETIRYGQKEDNTLSNVTRGFQGVAQSWQEGTKIARNFTAYDYDTLRVNVEGIQDELENLDLSAENVTLDSPNFTATNVLGGLEELFQRGVDVKQGLVDRLNAMNVNASTDETIDELLLKIMDISKDANAVAGDVLAGKTYYQGGEKETGTMVDRGNVNQTLTQQNQEYTIAAGKHGGAGKVRANISNLTAPNIKKGVNVGGVIGELSQGGLDKKLPTSNSGFTQLFNSNISSSWVFSNSSNQYLSKNDRVYVLNFVGGGNQDNRTLRAFNLEGTLVSTISFPDHSISGGIFTRENEIFRASNTHLYKYNFNGTLLETFDLSSMSALINRTQDIIYSDYYNSYLIAGYIAGSGIYKIDGTKLYSASVMGESVGFARFINDKIFLVGFKGSDEYVETYLVWRNESSWDFRSIRSTTNVNTSLKSLMIMPINLLRE